MDKAARWATVHGVTKSWTRLSDYHLLTLRSYHGGKQEPGRSQTIKNASDIGWLLWNEWFLSFFSSFEKSHLLDSVKYATYGYRKTILGQIVVGKCLIAK